MGTKIYAREVWSAYEAYDALYDQLWKNDRSIRGLQAVLATSYSSDMEDAKKEFKKLSRSASYPLYVADTKRKLNGAYIPGLFSYSEEIVPDETTLTVIIGVDEKGRIYWKEESAPKKIAILENISNSDEAYEYEIYARRQKLIQYYTAKDFMESLLSQEECKEVFEIVQPQEMDLLKELFAEIQSYLEKNKLTRCKGCGKYYIIKEEEIEWFKAKGYDLPKRCKECRKKRKGGA